MEQDRAPAVRLHHPELARQTAGQPSGHRQLIANTTTDTGLTVACRLDDNTYQKGIKVSDAEMAALNIRPANFHGEWNYTFVHGDPMDEAVIRAQTLRRDCLWLRL